MSHFFKIHPDNPQGRLLDRAAGIIRAGGLLVYPTDACYALGCQMDDKATMERIGRIRQAGQGSSLHTGLSGSLGACDLCQG